MIITCPYAAGPRCHCRRRCLAGARRVEVTLDERKETHTATRCTGLDIRCGVLVDERRAYELSCV